MPAVAFHLLQFENPFSFFIDHETRESVKIWDSNCDKNETSLKKVENKALSMLLQMPVPKKSHRQLQRLKFSIINSMSKIV